MRLCVIERHKRHRRAGLRAPRTRRPRRHRRRALPSRQSGLADVAQSAEGPKDRKPRTVVDPSSRTELASRAWPYSHRHGRPTQARRRAVRPRSAVSAAPGRPSDRAAEATGRWVGRRPSSPRSADRARAPAVPPARPVEFVACAAACFEPAAVAGVRASVCGAGLPSVIGTAKRKGAGRCVFRGVDAMRQQRLLSRPKFKGRWMRREPGSHRR